MAVEKFFAGRVSYNETTHECVAEPLKGQITVLESEEEGPMFYDFVWAPREPTPGVENDEFLVIAGDVSWKHIALCTTGRVFRLTIESLQSKFYYWMQHVNDDDDEPGKLSKEDLRIQTHLNEVFGDAGDEEDTIEEPREVAAQA